MTKLIRSKVLSSTQLQRGSTEQLTLVAVHLQLILQRQFVIIFEECFNIGIQFCVGVDDKLFVVIFLMELYSEPFSRTFLNSKGNKTTSP
jgi:hypothetical protein